MRENIGKYRGKQEESGEWIEGSVVLSQSKQAYIVSERECKTCGDEVDCRHEKFPCYKNCIEVIPETVGEYTGLKDKSGVEIYEGDKVRKEDNLHHTGVVVWWEDMAQFCIEYNQTEPFYISPGSIHNVQVIGNIHTEDKP